ncbi:MAG: glutathione transferase GstA, partial [Steroidobacteraceae bacterium]|nr:glutathione transferase GstA [Steroidobacteraceae bacterium]
SLAAHIALHEAGLPFTAVKVDGATKTANGVDYLAINPKGYVPALKLGNGEVLTECTAVLPYIADQASEKRLAPPAGTLARYRLHEWLGYINSEVHKGFSAFFTPGTTDAAKEAARANLDKKFQFLQKQLSGREYLLPDGYSVADCYLFTVLGWLGYLKIDIGQWPVLKAYRERIMNRPAVQAALRAEGLLQ